MAYVLSNEVRSLIGLTTGDLNNDDLIELIDLATQMVIEELTIEVVEEQPIGSINGSNTTYEIGNCPLADITGDKLVNASDVIVYTWTDEDDPSTKSTIAVTTVYDTEGKVVVTTAPTSSVKKIGITYSYLLETADLNWELIKMATSYLVGYIFAIRKFTVVPDSVSRGPIRFRHYTKPYNEYLNKYFELMRLIKSKSHIKKRSTDVTLDRSRM